MKTINIRKFPEDLHKLAKVAAAKEGKTLQDWFIEAVQEKIERDKKK
ncbi:toxin-antitoxin system HicB family antitoxin [Oleidesulfovibrio sp.]